MTIQRPSVIQPSLRLTFQNLVIFKNTICLWSERQTAEELKKKMRGEVDAEEDEEALQVGSFILDNMDHLSMGQAVQVVHDAIF